jgi:hypothetical protein
LPWDVVPAPLRSPGRRRGAWVGNRSFWPQLEESRSAVSQFNVGALEDVVQPQEVRVWQDRALSRRRLVGVALHTLRHTFASVAGDLGFSELTIAALLGHAARGVTQRYIHIDEAQKLAADKIAGDIFDLLEGRATAPRARGRHTVPAERPFEIASSEP